jgi:hypothetical protein
LIVGFALRHLHVAKCIYFPHRFRLLIHHLVERLGLHLHLHLMADLFAVDRQLKRFVLRV